jgi:hypothetical protein
MNQAVPRIRAFPKLWYWAVILFSSLFTAIPVSGGIMKLAEWNGDKLSPAQLQLVILCVAMLAFICFSAYALRYMVWEVDEFAIYRGVFRGLIVPMDDIIFLRLGMPPRPESRMTESLMTSWLDHMRENALVIGLKENRILPLEITTLNHGRKVMEAIIAAHGSASREAYSPDQKSALLSSKMNAIISVARR